MRRQKKAAKKKEAPAAANKKKPSSSAGKTQAPTKNSQGSQGQGSKKQTPPAPNAQGKQAGKTEPPKSGGGNAAGPGTPAVADKKKADPAQRPENRVTHMNHDNGSKDKLRESLKGERPPPGQPAQSPQQRQANVERAQSLLGRTR